MRGLSGDCDDAVDEGGGETEEDDAVVADDACRCCCCGDDPAGCTCVVLAVESALRLRVCEGGDG